MKPRGSRTKLVIVSDSHLAERATEFRTNWVVVHRWILRERPDIVVHLGDISAAGDINSADLREAAGILGGIQPGVLALPGNHDVGDNPGQHSGRSYGAHGRPVTTARHLETYHALFGADHWSVSLPGWQIIGLNAQLFGSGLAAEASQQEWLLEELAGGVGRVGVMLHKPLWCNATGDNEPPGRYVPLLSSRRLLSDLRQRDVAFIVSGHTHQTRRFLSEGIERVWAPSTAFVLPDSLQEPVGDKVVGAMTLDLDPNGYSFRLHVPDALRQHNLLDHEHVYPEVAQVRQKLRAGS